MHESFYQGFSGQRQSDPPQTLTRRIYSKSPERSNGNQWKTCFLGPTLVLDGLFFFLPQRKRWRRERSKVPRGFTVSVPHVLMSYLANDGLMQQDCSGNGGEIECAHVGCVHCVLGNQVQREPESRKLLFQCVWRYGAVIFHFQLFGRAGFMRRKDFFFLNQLKKD